MQHDSTGMEQEGERQAAEEQQQAAAEEEQQQAAAAEQQQQQQLQGQAQELLLSRRWHACISLLAPCAPASPPSTPAPARAVMQALAVASVHFHAAAGRWHSVLRLPEPSSPAPPDQGGVEVGPAQQQHLVLPEGLVRRQYRLLCTLVHPDKCPGLPHAAEAFVLLGQALQQLLPGGGAKRKLGEAGGGGPEARRQRRGDESEDDDSCRAADAGCEEECGDYAWWGSWDVPPDERRLPSTEPTAAEEADAELWGMELEALRQEVALRQRLIFAPAAQDGLTIHDRQRRLRAARSILSQRLAQDRRQC